MNIAKHVHMLLYSRFQMSHRFMLTDYSVILIEYGGYVGHQLLKNKMFKIKVSVQSH